MNKRLLPLLSRYIIVECFLFFLASLLAFTAVLLTVRMLRFTSLIVNKGVFFSQIAEVFLSIIPSFLEVSVPMAALLGVLLAFARFSSDSEIVVIRSSGISLYQLLLPVTAFALIVFSVSLLVSNFLRPWGNANLNRVLFEIARSKSTAGLDSGIFNKLGNVSIYAEQIDHYKGKLEKVLFDDRRDLNARRIILAKNGQISSDPIQRTISFDLSDGEIHELIEGKYATTEYLTNSIVLDADSLLNESGHKKDPESSELSRSQIRANIKELSSVLSGKATPEDKERIIGAKKTSPERRLARLYIEIGRRLSVPVASILLALIAMPLGIHSPREQRAWGVSLSVLVGVGVFILYYGFLSIGIALAESGSLNPFIALWAPNIVTAILATVFVYKLSSEKWESVAAGIATLSQIRLRQG